MMRQNLKIKQPYTKVYEILDILILCGAEFALLRFGLNWVHQTGYRYALGAAACFVFAAYFLYRFMELRMDGSIYEAFVSKSGSQVLVQNAHRYYYFRTDDISKITYDEEKRCLTVVLSRCFTRHCGLFSSDRLWIYQPEDEEFTPDDQKIYNYMGNLKENRAQHLSITDDGALWLGMIPKWTEISHLMICGIPIPYSFSIVCLFPEEAETFIQSIHPEDFQAQDEPAAEPDFPEEELS